jgi:hypothetical protein
MVRRAKRMEDTAETIVVDSEDRLARFGDAVSRLRGGRRIDIDRVQLIGGGALAVLGLLAILFGWWGSAHTGLPFEQTPYLISGGLLGLALCFLGGFLYFAYWITRLVRESRAQTERAAELLDQIAETLSSNGYSRTSRPRAIAGAGAEFVATRSGTFFHRPDCATVTGRTKLRKVTAKTPGLEPCRICDPLAEAD